MSWVSGLEAHSRGPGPSPSLTIWGSGFYFSDPGSRVPLSRRIRHLGARIQDKELPAKQQFCQIMGKSTTISCMFVCTLLAKVLTLLQGSKDTLWSVHCTAVARRFTAEESCSREVCTADILVKKLKKKIQTISN